MDYLVLRYLRLIPSVEGCFVFSTLLQNVIECKMVFRIVWNVLGLLQMVVDCFRAGFDCFWRCFTFSLNLRLESFHVVLGVSCFLVV